jgi:hypothetical protein
MTSKFTGLKYDDDCGFYAVHDGKIISPESGISGDKWDALMALVRSTQKAHDAQSSNPMTTAEKVNAAHADYMKARTLLATWESETKANEVARQLAA